MNDTEQAKQLFFDGLKAFQAADYDAAEGRFGRALELVPGRVSVIANLAATFLKNNKPTEARALLDKAIADQLYDPIIWMQLGLVNVAESRHSQALECLEKAIELEPGSAEAWMNKGHVLARIGKNDEALRHYLAARERAPESVQINVAIAKTHAALGDREHARASYYQVLRIDPDNIACYRYLAGVEQYRDGDERFGQLHALLQREDLSDTDRVSAYYALAKAYDDIDDTDAAFGCYESANRLRKADLSYRIDKDIGLFRSIRAFFEDYPVRENRQDRNSAQSLVPIFVVGMPRSGTTLVEQILASHSEVYGAGELEYLAEFAQPLFDAAPQELAVDAVDAAADGVMQRYLAVLGEHRIAEPHVVDKMPLNFRWLGLVLAAMPGAKVVNLVRNPTAVCWSNYRLYFPARGIGFAYDLQDLADYYCLYEDLMAFWRARFPGRIYDMHYERLTEDQEAETRRLLEYCGLPWQDQCLAFEKNTRAVQTASQLQVRRGMYRGSSDAWRKYAAHLGPIVKIDCHGAG